MKPSLIKTEDVEGLTADGGCQRHMAGLRGGRAMGVWVSEWKPRWHREGLRGIHEAPRN